LGITTDRRKHRRHKYEAVISHDILSQEATPAGKMYNFSKTGLYFESKHSFYPMEEIFVELIDLPKSPDMGFELVFDVEIVWRIKLEDSSFQYGYGARFKYANESFEKAIGVAKYEKQRYPQPVSEDADDSREYPRQRYHKSLIFNYQNKIYRGLVTNISRSGAFIKTRGKFSLGQHIQFVITGKKIRYKVKLMGWIVRLSPNGFGVSFDRRSGAERRYDIDRRIGTDRRSRIKHQDPDKKGR
jgi:Tfp pilus assembly protein PilZ